MEPAALVRALRVLPYGTGILPSGCLACGWREGALWLAVRVPAGRRVLRYEAGGERWEGEVRLPDLVVGSEKGGALAFRNTSSRRGPLRFTPVPGFSPALPPVSTPAIADLDGDGVLDIVSGTVAGGVVFYRGR